MSDSFLQWRPHPWHGLDAGPDLPEWVNVFVEITPFDRVKYEIDKYTGYLKIDRPQYSASLPPSAYGFIPRTLSSERVCSLMDGAKEGDGDPLDACVVSSHPITHQEILLTARIIGGIPMLDNGAADDKMIAILKDDGIYGDVTDIADIPQVIISQLIHYFSTYKRIGKQNSNISVGSAYGKNHARDVVMASLKDYEKNFSR